MHPSDPKEKRERKEEKEKERERASKIESERAGVAQSLPPSDQKTREAGTEKEEKEEKKKGSKKESACAIYEMAAEMLP